MFSMKSLQQYKWNQTDINIYISSYLEFSVVTPKSRHTEKFSYNNMLIQIQYCFDKVKYWLKHKLNKVYCIKVKDRRSYTEI